MLPRFLPEPEPRLIDSSFLMSRPLAPPPPSEQRLPSYYGPVRQRAPRPVLNAYGVLPRHAPSRDLGGLRPRTPFRRSPSHVPYKSRRPGSRRLHAGTAWPTLGPPPSSSRRACNDLRFGCHLEFCASPAHARHLERFWNVFLSPPDRVKPSLFPIAHHDGLQPRSTGCGACARRPTPEGQQSSISRKLRYGRDLLHDSSLAFVTHCRDFLVELPHFCSD